MSIIPARFPALSHSAIVFATGLTAGGFVSAIHGDNLSPAVCAVILVGSSGLLGSILSGALMQDATRYVVMALAWAVMDASAHVVELARASASLSVALFLALGAWSLTEGRRPKFDRGGELVQPASWPSLMLVGLISVIGDRLCTSALDLPPEKSFIVLVGYTLGAFRIAYSCKQLPRPLNTLLAGLTGACGFATAQIVTEQAGPIAVNVAGLSALALLTARSMVIPLGRSAALDHFRY